MIILDAALKRRSLAPAIVTLAVILAGCSESPAPQADAPRQPVRVEVARPQAVSSVETVGAMGRLETYEEATLSFKSPGVIASIAVDIGDRIEAGQVLARLESTELESAQARAAEALAKAQRDLTRSEELFQRGVLPRQAVDDARTAREMAAADLSAAEFNLSLAEIRATSAGRVLQRMAEPREIVGPGAPILKVSGDTRDWLLRVDVSDRHVVRVDSAVRAWVQFDAFPEQSFSATVSRISAEADPATAMFSVEFLLSGGDAQLRSGMLGTAYIELQSNERGSLVPVGSLVGAERGRARLFVADASGTAELRDVATGKLHANGIVITEGLEAEDEVIIRGASFVDDGSPIIVGRG